MTEAKLAYVAGFVDGEGCFTLSNHGATTLSIINTSKTALLFVQEVLGVGTVNPRKQRVNKNQYIYRAYGSNCIGIVEKLLPYLIEKKEQAQVLLEYHNTPKTERKPGSRGAHSIVDRETFITRLKELKRREE
jgi:hypothetical protein